MPGPTLSADELAEELGRSTSWLYEQWRQLCAGAQAGKAGSGPYGPGGKTERMPYPLNAGAPPLVWSRAQVYAWLDRDLDKDQRIAAAAYRAAAAAAANTRHVPAASLVEDEWRARLDAKFASKENA